jgi:hypothetical protein
MKATLLAIAAVCQIAWGQVRTGTSQKAASASA